MDKDITVLRTIRTYNKCLMRITQAVQDNAYKGFNFVESEKLVKILEDCRDEVGNLLLAEMYSILEEDISKIEKH